MSRGVMAALASLGLGAALLGAAAVFAGTGAQREVEVDAEGCEVPARLKALWPAPSEVAFRPSTLAERAQVGALVKELLEAAASGRLPKDARERADAARLVLETLHERDGVLWVLREPRGRLRGAGAYVIRAGQASTDVVQVPHAYFDRGTGTLGLTLFSCGDPARRPRVFMTNTAHRFRGRPGERRADRDHPADLAHQPGHLFTAVTDRVLQALPGARLFQLHGFDHRGREKSLAAVVSGGAAEAAPRLHAVVDRLVPVLEGTVRLFGRDTDELGATRNTQARLVARYPGARFVHLELSPKAREALESPGHAARFARALFAPEQE